MQEIAVDLIYSLNTKRRFNSHAKCTVWVSVSFEKINVITACCENIYGRYCIQKSKNDQLHPQFAIIVFIIKSCSFSVVKNKQTRLRYLVLEKFITCLPPEKPRDYHFYPISPKRVQKWRASWIRSVTTFTIMENIYIIQDMRCKHNKYTRRWNKVVS